MQSFSTTNGVGVRYKKKQTMTMTTTKTPTTTQAPTPTKMKTKTQMKVTLTRIDETTTFPETGTEKGTETTPVMTSVIVGDNWCRLMNMQQKRDEELQMSLCELMAHAPFDQMRVVFRMWVKACHIIDHRVSRQSEVFANAMAISKPWQMSALGIHMQLEHHGGLDYVQRELNLMTNELHRRDYDYAALQQKSERDERKMARMAKQLEDARTENVALRASNQRKGDLLRKMCAAR
jgi:hypothetical protein